MPQTLLALLALAISSILVLSQQRLTLGSRQQMLSDEIELAASGLSSDVMEMIGARSFDEKSTPEAVFARQFIPREGGDFTSPGNLGSNDRGGSGCNLLRPGLTPECDDVDDVAASVWTPVSVELAHGRSLPFEVKIDVYYVDDPASITRASGRTRHKRVTLTVRSPHLRNRTADGAITTTRVISYDPIKAEQDFERLYGPLGVNTPPAGIWTPNENDETVDTAP